MLKTVLTKRVKLLIAAVVLTAISLFFYTRYLSPTKIALVNFRDFQYAAFLDADNNPFIKIDRIALEGDKPVKLSKYNVIYLFSMGMRLNEKQAQSVRKAIAKGVKVYSYAATSSESDLTNIIGDELDAVEGYFSNGGKKNTKRLLNYSRRVLHKRKFFTKKVQPPFIIPFDVFFYLGDDVFFQTFQEYQDFYSQKGLLKEDRPKVAVVTTNIGPRNANREHIDMFIRQLEEENLNVYPISGFSKRLEFLKKIDPSLVVLMPHGRFVPGDAEASVEWLKEKNIPLICPVTVFRGYDEWLKDQRGMAGGALSQSIVVPELDGGIYPYVFGAQFKDKNGLYIFQGIPNRIDKLAKLINKWLLLAEKDNSEKKIAIYYYKGPGLNAMIAGGMEVAPSLLNLLRVLKDNGYETGELPKNEDELIKIINKQGPILGAYAKGTFQEYLENGDPELIAVEDYLEWCKNDLPLETYAEVIEYYGEAPGDYMSVKKDGTAYLSVARVRFGNVVLLPQPLPAYGNNEFNLIHGAKKAPPHTYIASYLWVKNGFNCDAVIHFGTHGSLEFTPWKQVALSEYDWPDALIGGMPHVYIYVINNIGEAIIAKRRSYAAIVSYLTPPFTESDLYGRLNGLHDKFHSYLKAEDPALKNEYLKSIKEQVLNLGLNKDIGLENFKEQEITPEIFDRVHNYIHSIEQEKITKGLYTLGIPYKREDAYETARMMAIDPLAYSLAKLDLLRGHITAEKFENAHYFDAEYRQKAFEIIEKIINQKRSPDEFLNVYDNEALKAWEEKNKEVKGQGLMADMMQLAEAGRKIKKYDTRPLTSEDSGLLRQLVLKIAPDKGKRDFLISLKDYKKLKKALALLDPASAAKARKIAVFIPEMKKAITLAGEEDMRRLLGLMKNAQARKIVFDYLDNPQVLAAIKKEEAAVKKQKIGNCLNSEFSKDLFLAMKAEELKTAMDTWDEQRLAVFRKNINFYLENSELYPEIAEIKHENARAVSAIMSGKTSRKLLNEALAGAEEKIQQARERNKEIIDAIRTYKETLYSVREYFKSVGLSTAAETESIINTLNGGYILPSSGGDPVSNPDSVPTGRNMYSIDSEKTPTEEAWKVGKKLADGLIASKLSSTGQYPKKVAFTLWGGEFIRDQGVNLSEIFYLLGVEPVRNSRGVVHDVRLIPSSELKRPRIDVVVQTSGQFRDIAATRVYLINKAVKMASAAKNDEYDNYVIEGTLRAEEVMKTKGLSPLEARNYSTARVFGGLNGNYGTGIMGLVESGDKWEDDKEISDRYLKNMGAVYTQENWGFYKEGIFEASLQGADTVIQPRSSNTWGPLSLDHVYEFMGGINATIRNVTGEDPEAYFNDFRNKQNARVQGVKEAIWVETRATLFNPKYIKGMREGGASSAEQFAETFRNTYGWNVMKPKAIDREIWDGLYDVYVKDSYDLDMEEFFRDKNPYALQEMTAVMLETVRKGYWQPGDTVIKDIARLHAELVKDYKAGCSGFVCDNAKLREMIAGAVSPNLRKAYQEEISKARTGKAREVKEGMKLEKERMTLEKVKKIVTENKAVFFTMMFILIFFPLAVILGAVKRRM